MAFLKRALSVLLLVTAVGGVGSSVYFYRQYQAVRQNPNIVAQQEAESLVATIGKMMMLPKDEVPGVVTIVDKTKLSDQKFFQNTENGDKLLTYTKIMKAILYRPSTNKIIEVSPLYIDQSKPTSTPSGDVSAEEKAPAPPVAQVPTGPMIAYYNGTLVAGFAEQTKNLIRATYPNYQDGIMTDASKQDYKKTLVIDISGKFSSEVGGIASLVGGVVGSIPVDEISPNADILVILGK